MNTNFLLEKPKNFLEKYNIEFAPKINAIDLFMRSGYNSITTKKTSELLYISETEVIEIINYQNISKINKTNFFIIMKNGSSNICHMFARLLERGIPDIYYPNDISYIYNIDIDVVLDACSEIGETNFNSSTLKDLFLYIPL